MLSEESKKFLLFSILSDRGGTATLRRVDGWELVACKVDFADSVVLFLVNPTSLILSAFTVADPRYWA